MSFAPMSVCATLSVSTLLLALSHPAAAQIDTDRGRHHPSPSAGNDTAQYEPQDVSPGFWVFLALIPAILVSVVVASVVFGVVQDRKKARRDAERGECGDECEKGKEDVEGDAGEQREDAAWSCDIGELDGSKTAMTEWEEWDVVGGVVVPRLPRCATLGSEQSDVKAPRSVRV